MFSTLNKHSALRALVALTLITSISASVIFARDDDIAATETKRQLDGLPLGGVVGTVEGLVGGALGAAGGLGGSGASNPPPAQPSSGGDGSSDPTGSDTPTGGNEARRLRQIGRFINEGPLIGKRQGLIPGVGGSLAGLAEGIIGPPPPPSGSDDD
ncbi:hypothetical protein VKT23_000211 [Stygiomarasmius scandens]|uniref:Uncharacterized protein n=1 Tax=Marasmiellus scandens TaxID=2682957 RepID=A0ABR1K4H8_9AGAR